MNIAKIKYNSIGNFEGISTSVYVSGCEHRCCGCFQPETWNPKYGEPYTQDMETDIINSLRPRHITSLVLLGGEPFLDVNIPELVDLCKKVRHEFQNTINIVAFSGFTFEQITSNDLKSALLHELDVLIDGKFEQSLYSPLLKFRGSQNQRIIMVKDSLKNKEVVLSELNNSVL